MRGLVASLAMAVVSACTPAPRPVVIEEPALWRIADADSEIWLFGTVHVLPPELAWRGPRFEAAFAAAEELVVETDAAGAETAALTAQYGMLPAGQRLSAQIGPEADARLGRQARALGLDPASLEPMRPWLAALRLSYAYAVRRGFNAAAGVEGVLVPEARARGVRVRYLETPEQQVRTLADLPAPVQVAFLEASLDQIEQGGDPLSAMVSAWAVGDAETLDGLLRAELNEAGPEAYDAIIVRRNRAWADEIAARLVGEGDSFYAVGAAHLTGPDGVVTLLRARDIAVEGP
ncbi:MAG: TraB/GumN family protein [Hyphomonadaceae bacterium]